MNHFINQFYFIGPCQFPTLGFVVEQYLKVKRFRPEPFWYLDLQIEKAGEINKFNWKRGHLFDQLITLILYERSINASDGLVKITRVEEKPTSKYRPLPLRTVEFQKAASRFLKISSDQCMNLAEKLYNRGFISYPRTETDIFEFNGEQLRTLVQKQKADNVFGEYASDLLDSGGFRIPRKGKNNDKAHPPIHPTSSGEGLSGQERAVFEFVSRRFLACCSEDAKGMETKISAQVGIEEFECKGIRVTELNYLMVYKYEKWAEQEIAPFRQGETLAIKEFFMKEGMTSAPLLLTESDLITCMDKNGIGTDATIHEHIHKIIVRKYAVKGRDSRFVPTRLGVALVEAFDHLGLEFSLTQPKIRSKLEKDLSSICEGRLTKNQVIHESKEMYRQVYRKVENNFNQLKQIFGKYLGHGGNNNNNNNNSDDDDEDLPPGNPFDPMPFARQTKLSGDDTDNYDNSDGGDGFNDKNSNKRKRATGGIGTGRGRKPKEAATTYKKPRKTAAKTKVIKNSTSNPNCFCSISATMRTVSKEGPNLGKQFWGCSKDFKAPDNCKFFEWVDADDGNNNDTAITARQGNKNYSTKNPQIDDEGEMRCKCGLIMKREVMKGGKDVGRWFVKCPKIIQKCGIFTFLDGQSSNNTSIEENEMKMKKQKCFKCNKMGHWATSCPN